MKKRKQIDILVGTILAMTDKTKSKRVHEIAYGALKRIRPGRSLFVKQYEKTMKG